MKCQLCSKTATEKHHITYYHPVRTIAVCEFHGDDIHNRPWKYPGLLQYKKGEGRQFYSQKKRVDKALRRLNRIGNRHRRR